MADDMTFGVNIIPKDNTVSLGNSENKWAINGVSDPKLTDTTYDTATQSTAGLMSATDKTKLDNIENGAEVNPDIANNLTETTTGKVLDATQGKVLNDSKLENDFSSLSVASTPYNGNEQIALYSGGENYSTTVNELLSAAGSSGSSQSALVNYVKNCGTISSLPQTFTDANITADMVVLESVLGTPSAQTGDWTVTTSNGSVTISGSISGSTTLMLYFGVGMSAAPTLLTNLASTSAANILDTASRPGVMGVLPVANGGTGGNSASTARTNLDVYNKGEVDSAIQQSATNVAAGIAIHGYRLEASLSSFISCTGNAVAVPIIILSGGYAQIQGRVVINNYVRTGGNPGVIVTIPNGKKVKNTFLTTVNGYIANESRVLLGELVCVQGNAGESVISIFASESYANLTGTTAFFVLSPIVFEIT